MTAALVTATFGGARVALLESRLARETAAVVTRLGGVPVSAPALAEAALDVDREVRALVDRHAAVPDGIVILLTGSATTRLFAAADRLGREADLAAVLTRAVIVARGPKPAGALARRGIPATLTVPAPYVTQDVIDALGALDVSGRPVTVVHYGERNHALLAALARRGARLHELLLYEWRLPADVGPLSRAIDQLIRGEIPVLALTSQVQIRHLIQVAGTPRRRPLLDALNGRVVVGAVGPTCAAACISAGIRAPVVPEQPKLAPLLVTLARAYTGSR